MPASPSLASQPHIGPWFEPHQGRSVAIALTGASIVVPLLVVSINRFGFTPAMSGSSLLTAAVLLSLVGVALRYRRPSELGLVPDEIAGRLSPCCCADALGPERGDGGPGIRPRPRDIRSGFSLTK